MSMETNKTLIRRIPEEMYNRGNLSVADEVFAPDYQEHHPLPPDWPAGIPGVKQFVIMIREAFPDFHYTIEDMLAEGDKVVVRLSGSGTHQGNFMGIPPTGRQARWTEIHIVRVANNKLVEHWVNSDQLGMLQQLGVVPT